MNHTFVRIALVFALVAAVGLSRMSAAASTPPAPASAPDQSWAKVIINPGAEQGIAVSIETDVLRLDYGPDIKPGSATVHKALALVHKPSGQKIGPFDSRYSPSRAEFLTLRSAEQLRSRSANEVTVRLYFLTRVLDVTLTKGSSFVRFDYTYLNDSRHTYDQMALSDAANLTYFFSGQEAYSEHMGWFGAHSKKEAAYAPYPFSFYRHDWVGGKFLDYKGWLIIGAGSSGKLGYGAIMPLAKIRWLKLMAKSGGLERIMKDNATVYFYLVPDFSAERGRQIGESFVDGLK